MVITGQSYQPVDDWLISPMSARQMRPPGIWETKRDNELQYLSASRRCRAALLCFRWYIRCLTLLNTKSVDNLRQVWPRLPNHSHFKVTTDEGPLQFVFEALMPLSMDVRQWSARHSPVVALVFHSRPFGGCVQPSEALCLIANGIGSFRHLPFHTSMLTC